MANREAASSRSSWQRVRDAITAHRVLAYVLMPLLLLCAFASLIALNLLLRDLWGELAYAVLVTGVALWALSQTQVVTRLFERLGVRPFTIRRATPPSAAGPEPAGSASPATTTRATGKASQSC